MSEQFHPERPDEAALAAERSEIYDAARAERVALNAELSPDQIRTGELLAYIVEQYPQCAEPEQAAAACFEREGQMRGALGDSFDLTQPHNAAVMDLTVGEFAQIEARVAAVESLEVEQVVATETLDLRNQGAAAVQAAAERTGVAVPPIPAVRERAELAEDPADIVAAAASMDEAREIVAEPAVLRMEDTIATNRVLLEQEQDLNRMALEREEEAQERLSGATEFQANYEALRAENPGAGHKKLLQLLLAETDNPEHKDRIVETLANISTLENALPPERRAAVSRFINNANLDLGAANSAAVFAEVFSSMEASDEFTAEEVAVLRASIGGADIQTGGDANEAFERGVEETYVDENGVTQTRFVPLEPGDRIPFGEGHELGLDETGKRQAWVRTEIGVYQADLPENARDEDMGNIIRTVQLRAKLQELNVASIFFNDVDELEFGGGRIDVHPDHFATTDRFLNTVVSNRAIAGNDLLRGQDLDQIDYLLQFHDRRGDLGDADLDPQRIREDYAAQGIIDQNGMVDWDRFNELIEANRSNLYQESGYAQNVV